MGAAPSAPAPPPESASDRQARLKREADAYAAARVKAAEDAAIKKAAEDAADAKATAAAEAAADAEAAAEDEAELKDEDNADREIQLDAQRQDRLSRLLDEAKRKRGFKRPLPISNSLSIATSANGNACRLSIDPTLSSSTVILSRNILSKMRLPGQVQPVSNLPSKPKENCAPTVIPDCSSGCWYEPPYRRTSSDPEKPATDKSVAKGTLLSDADVGWQNNGLSYYTTYMQQCQVEQVNRKKFSKANISKRVVRVWNPSDDPLDKYGSLAVNYHNHGALTKLFLKPTIPFQFTFDPYGTAPIAPAPLAQRIEPSPAVGNLYVSRASKTSEFT